MKLFLDSSFILSYALESDENFKEADMLIEQENYSKKIVTSLIMLLMKL